MCKSENHASMVTQLHIYTFHYPTSATLIWFRWVKYDFNKMSVHQIFILSILFSLNHKNLFKFIFSVISPVKYEEVRGKWKRFIIGTIVLDSLLQCKILKAQELKLTHLRVSLLFSQLLNLRKICLLCS